MTIREIRKQLILQKGYEDTQLPTNQTLLNKTNELGYKLTKVRKIKPLKKIEETDLIFEKIQEVRKEYQEKANVVILSIDAKDKVKIGEFSRGGKSRSVVRCYGTLYMDLFSVTLVKLIHTTYSLVGGIIIFSIIATARVPGGWGWKTPRSFNLRKLGSNNVTFYNMWRHAKKTTLMK